MIWTDRHIVNDKKSFWEIAAKYADRPFALSVIVQKETQKILSEALERIELETESRITRRYYSTPEELTELNIKLQSLRLGRNR